MIHFSDIVKQFPGNKALDSTDFTVDKGEIHIPLGENGVGKSTLLNTLHGIYPGYDGSIEIDEKKVDFKNVSDIVEFDITKVHQEVNLMIELTMGQNIAFGYEVTKRALMDYDIMYRKTDTILEKLGCKFRSRNRVTSLNTGEMQVILVAKTLFHNVRIISFDKPISVLTGREADRLLEMIMEPKDQGITILYITHHLDEVLSVADRASILRDGKYITILNIKETSKEGLIHHMVGRGASVYAVRNNPLCAAGEVMLEARDLCKNGVFEYISSELHRGEILFFAGLAGSKRTDVMQAIFEADLYTNGEVYIKRKKAGIKGPKSALWYSLGLIPENRKTQGFIESFTNASNMALASMNRFCNKGFTNARKTYDSCMYYTGEANLYPAESNYLIESLSGRNAQKAIVTRWMITDAGIIIFDEPTEGTDVGAKTEICRLTEDLIAGGEAIIMVSSELPEVVGMSDRVMVMRENKIIGFLNHSKLNEEVIMSLVVGD